MPSPHTARGTPAGRGASTSSGSRCRRLVGEGHGSPLSDTSCSTASSKRSTASWRSAKTGAAPAIGECMRHCASSANHSKSYEIRFSVQRAFVPRSLVLRTRPGLCIGTGVPSACVASLARRSRATATPARQRGDPRSMACKLDPVEVRPLRERPLTDSSLMALCDRRFTRCGAGWPLAVASDPFGGRAPFLPYSCACVGLKASSGARVPRPHSVRVLLRRRTGGIGNGPVMLRCPETGTGSRLATPRTSACWPPWA